MQKTILFCARPWTVLEPPQHSVLIRYPNCTANDMVLNGFPEYSLIDWSKQFCSKDKTFVDAGAHCGMYSLTLAPFCGRVHAFECQRQTFYQLCGGIALNNAWNVEAHQIALGDKNQSVSLNVISLDGGGSTLLPQARGVLETQLVQMKPLDDYGLDDVSFLKLDVEGSEKKLLMGARETLSRCHNPPFLFEVNEAQRLETEAYVRELNYSISPIANYPHMRLASR